MGRLITVSDMPQEAQKHLGILNKNSPGMIRSPVRLNKSD